MSDIELLNEKENNIRRKKCHALPDEEGAVEYKRRRIDTGKLVETTRHFLGETRCNEVDGTHLLHFIRSNTSVTDVLKVLKKNRFQSALVYEEDTREFSGFVDVVDIVVMVVDMFQEMKSGETLESYEAFEKVLEAMDTLDSTQVASISNLSKRNPLYILNGDATLLEAMEVMTKHKCHRVAIREEIFLASIAGLLCQSAVVGYLSNHMERFKDFSCLTVKAMLDENTRLRNVISVNASESGLEAFRIISSRRVTGIPVVNDSKHVVGSVSASDIRNILSDNDETSNGNLKLLFGPVSEMIRQFQMNNNEIVLDTVSCSEDDTMGIVVSKIADNKVHRVFVVNEAKELIGIISTVDILEEFLKI